MTTFYTDIMKVTTFIVYTDKYSSKKYRYQGIKQKEQSKLKFQKTRL